MARFSVDPGRLNFNNQRSGKEYNLRVLQRAQSIFSTLLALLPSNYTSTVQGPNYTIEIKAVAVELAKIELALEDVNRDVDYSSTRSDFLYSIVAYLCFLNNRVPTLNQDDDEFRQFLLNLIRIYFQGSVPKSIKDAVGLFLKTDFQILENFLLVRQGTAGLDISDEFGFQISVVTQNQFPTDIFDLQSSIRIILDIVRPAHTLFTIRFIFTDNYNPNEPTGKILDSMKWKLQSYYYEDYRNYWTGLRDIDRLGKKENQVVVGENHTPVATFEPSDVPEVSAWLRLERSTNDGTNYTSIFDQFNAPNGASQATPLRRPALGSSGGLPIARFQSSDPNVLVWPLASNNDAVSKWAFAAWVRLTTTSGFQTLVSRNQGTNGTSHRQIELGIDSSRRFVVDAYLTDTDGRQALSAMNSVPAAGTWFWVFALYDGTIGGDGSVSVRINGTTQSLTFSNIGAGGTLSTLPLATGNILIGNQNDGSASGPLNGDLGPNLFVLDDEISPTVEAQLMNYQRPS